MIQPTRIQPLNDKPERDGASYVLYWMGLSQRTACNPALEHAADLANERHLPLVVCYGIAEGFPEVNARHWTFMMQGTAEIGPRLRERGIGWVARREPPVQTALIYAANAALVVCDRNYLKPIRRFYEEFADQAPCRVIQVEGDVVVPIQTASPKHEFAARTLRPKLGRLMPEYIVPLHERTLRVRADALKLDSTLTLDDIPALVADLRCDQSIRPVKRFKGGASQAESRLKAYLAGPFAGYGAERGKPEAGAASHMSPYLHFGQISPVAIALAVQGAPVGDDIDRTAYLEEIIVRRELAMNHVFYTDNYDDYAAMPDWCRKTLDAHRGDERPFRYSFDQFQNGETHDRHWNAAMSEMRETGYMHNHMRMYWGKKILEWSATPEDAWDTTLRLNNTWFIDGRDANSYTNVGWLFGLHDRPWGTRPVYGTVRSMGPNSLKKFDAEAYLRDVDRLVAAEGTA